MIMTRAFIISSKMVFMRFVKKKPKLRAPLHKGQSVIPQLWPLKYKRDSTLYMCEGLNKEDIFQLSNATRLPHAPFR